jgi:hypothetical protein
LFGLGICCGKQHQGCHGQEFKMFHLSILVRKKISGFGFSSLSSCGIAWFVVQALAITCAKITKDW